MARSGTRRAGRRGRQGARTTAALVMLAGLLICLRSNSASAGAPEPLDTEFLDYLLACESKDDNWTVVADDKLRKKAEQG